MSQLAALDVQVNNVQREPEDLVSAFARLHQVKHVLELVLREQPQDAHNGLAS